MSLCGCQNVGAANRFLVWNVGGYLGEGRPLTLRDIIATEIGVVAIWRWCPSEDGANPCRRLRRTGSPRR